MLEKNNKKEHTEKRDKRLEKKYLLSLNESKRNVRFNEISTNRSIDGFRSKASFLSLFLSLFPFFTLSFSLTLPFFFSRALIWNSRSTRRRLFWSHKEKRKLYFKKRFERIVKKVRTKQHGFSLFPNSAWERQKT